MPPDALTAILLVSGLALTVGGLALYRPGLKLLGALAGGGVGLFAAGGWSLEPVLTAVVVLLAGLAGLLLAKVLFTLLLLVAGGVTGLGVALALSGTPASSLPELGEPLVLAGPVIGAVLAVVFQQAIVVVASAGSGALLTWAAVEPAAVGELLADLAVTMPPEWVLTQAGVGILVQIGLWLAIGRRRQPLRPQIRGSRLVS
jgi:hypothetical protein